MDENDIEFSMDCDQSSPVLETAASFNEKSLIDIDDSTGNDLLRTIMEKLDNLEKFNETMLEKLDGSNENHKKSVEFNEKVLEELQKVRNEMKELKETQKKSVVEPVKKVIQAPIIKQNDLQNKFPISSRKFILRDIFKNISKIKEAESVLGECEEHFGVPWINCASFISGRLAFIISTTCSTRSPIGVELELKIMHPSGKSYSLKKLHLVDHEKPNAWCVLLNLKEIELNYLVNDTLIVEVHVNMKKMTGIYKDNMRSFDESNKDCSDILLIVEDEKFYVAKLFLATHSSYFKTMFLGLFDESKMSEITLTGIYSEDFQKYLEVLYGEPAIDEITVEGILLLGDMYDTEIVVRKCEEFLLKDSKKTLKKKLQMSVRYNLEKLKEKCLLEIKTIEDIQSVIPGDINDLDKTIMAILLEKSLSFK